MPVIAAEAYKPKRSVLIVGNGPSKRVLPWTVVLHSLRRKYGKCDTALMNREALAATSPPNFCVSIDPRILLAYQDAGLHETSRVVLNTPHKVARGRDSKLIGDLLMATKTILGKNSWPPLASGPLAVWMMSALGYSRIFLYALDGSAFMPDKPINQLRQWEAWIGRHLMSRRQSPYFSSKNQPRLIRVWPEMKEFENMDDPLEEKLHSTVRVRVPEMKP